jgi:hypothetical protein
MSEPDIAKFSVGDLVFSLKYFEGEHNRPVASFLGEVVAVHLRSEGYLYDFNSYSGVEHRDVAEHWLSAGDEHSDEAYRCESCKVWVVSVCQFKSCINCSKDDFCDSCGIASEDGDGWFCSTICEEQHSKR